MIHSFRSYEQSSAIRRLEGPEFIVLLGTVLQPSQPGRQQVSDGNNTAITIRLLLQNVSDDSSFVATRAARQLPHPRIQVRQQLTKRCLILLMKLPQLRPTSTRANRLDRLAIFTRLARLSTPRESSRSAWPR